MTKSIFIFIACIFILLPVLMWHGEMSPNQQALFCLPFILFLGIPHGAIDNVLYLRDNKVSFTVFLTKYLALIMFYVLLWLYFPRFTYVLFLLLSAYHFGQSQFSHYLQSKNISSKLVALLWGVFTLSTLIYFNIAEINSILKQSADLSLLSAVHDATTIYSIVLFSGIFLCLTFMYLFMKKYMQFEELLLEVFVLVLILSAYYLFPVFIGFTLYFVILHSVKVLREEYVYLKSVDLVQTPVSFIKLLGPLSLLSYFGIIFLFGLIYFEVLAIDYGYMFLIIISSITFPHIFVMNRFYKLTSKTKKISS